ncbi:MAG: hypothetical protein MUO97_10860 [Dehalococcoidia bacterium]|nr:hypothetical protein [Dehalococcoidia bacterium]
MPRRHHTFVTSPVKPTTTARINIPEEESQPFTQQRIMFSIECCGDKCCFKKIKEQRDKSDFAARLHELSQLTWGDIKQTGREGLGYETLDHIKVNRARVPAGARIIGFTYHDFHRMIGYRDLQGVFHIHWFDYDGKQYKH